MTELNEKTQFEILIDYRAYPKNCLGDFVCLFVFIPEMCHSKEYLLILFTNIRYIFIHALITTIPMHFRNIPKYLSIFKLFSIKIDQPIYVGPFKISSMAVCFFLWLVCTVTDLPKY